jgi:hypothetical protein
MPPTNKNIRTLRDISTESSFSPAKPDQQDSAAASGNYKNPPAVAAGNYKNPTDPTSKSSPKCLCIPSFSNSDFAKSLLERVLGEFLPIIQRRGYNVTTVSEMCCCGDGDGRKQKMGNNVWGYNQTTWRGGGKSHEIHLRLRHPQAHESRFFPYEDVAGTMAHELAHCERGPHDDKFFKIMEGILDEHASVMASGLAGGSSNAGSSNAGSSNAGSTTQHDTFSGNGQRLGGNGNAKKSRLLEGVGRKLGGDNSFQQWMTPAEAAVAAAEARQRQLRLRGTRCCRPCVIEITDDDDSKKPAAMTKKPPQKAGTQPAKKRRAVPDCIDLTADSDDDDDRKQPSPVTVADWSCPRCTFLNSSMATECDMCAAKQSGK